MYNAKHTNIDKYSVTTRLILNVIVIIVFNTYNPKGS